mmetsp:Transcript_1716/g.3275  ORF Transcript_1716/g.3275 Transcript_1716/m.3275 type:complete len:127 (-) Transcript_1716:3-383(-)
MKRESDDGHVWATNHMYKGNAERQECNNKAACKLEHRGRWQMALLRDAGGHAIVQSKVAAATLLASLFYLIACVQIEIGGNATQKGAELVPTATQLASAAVHSDGGCKTWGTLMKWDTRKKGGRWH